MATTEQRGPKTSGPQLVNANLEDLHTALGCLKKAIARTPLTEDQNAYLVGIIGGASARLRLACEVVSGHCLRRRTGTR